MQIQSLLLLASLTSPVCALPTGPSEFLPALTQVVHDVDGETLWAMGEDWKASFGPDGVRFIPFLGSDAPRNQPVDLRLAEATIGTRPLELAPRARVHREGNMIDLDRGDVIVRYHLGLEGIEQTFVLAELPLAPDGDLRVRVAVDSELALLEDGSGMRFAGERGGVRYGAATVLDGAGRSEGAQSIRGEGEITLRVPRSFLESATHPVVVDPLITTYSILATGADFEPGDLAYDPGQDRYLHAHTRYWSQSDRDVFSIFADRDGNLSDGAWVNISDDAYSHVRVANDAGSESFLIVAEEGDLWSSAIVARTRQSNGALGPVLDIASHPNIMFRSPSVGGDADVDVAGGFLVAWHGEVDGAEFLHRRIVNPDGSMENTLEFASEYYTGVHLAHVEVSRTNGRGLPGERRWNLVWGISEFGDYNDIMGSQVALNGQTTTYPFPVASTPTDHRWPVVAPPLDAPSGGPRDFLAIYSGDTDQGQNLHARLFKGSDFARSFDLTALEAEAQGDDSFVDRDQQYATVAVDGTQITIGYEESDLGIHADLYLSTFRLLGQDLIPTETRVPVENSSREAHKLRIVAEHESGEDGSHRVTAVHGREIPFSGLSLVGASYEMPTGYEFLGTVGCAGMPNSTGHASTFRAYGSSDPDDNSLWLDVDNLPPFQSGVFLMSEGNQVTPMGQGFLCVGTPIVRLSQTAGSSWINGMHGVQLDLPGLPAAAMIQAGQTWYFQYWHRDTGGTFNFSNSLAIPFD